MEISLVPEIIRHLDEEGLLRLRRSLDDYNQAVDGEDHYRRLMTDMKIHLTLASLSQCRIQLKMLQELFDLLLLKYTQNLLLLGITDSPPEEHDLIARAFISRDQPALQEALSTHLDHIRAHIIQGFKKLFSNKNASMVDLFTFLRASVGSAATASTRLLFTHNALNNPQSALKRSETPPFRP